MGEDKSVEVYKVFKLKLSTYNKLLQIKLLYISLMVTTKQKPTVDIQNKKK